ncbi:hypothetical protein ACVIHI_009164 [Bradyrhizobium sp. USDA 4524]|uniref:hypothetical protein n=1 Tax=unclassified Bradyrhizobium TaxID=2631580 RepID=UPI0020A16D59|nr:MULTISPECIES: hypothetical protein [unclassified Bradyrhizobium]MCP1846057.1 hypothetical protein [Bradyrhizobium sp. USDA 4538]MCP1907309.1 hypothetical protein [Bradyrhizobium sp. USDA 4537]MCP1985785.1 hypothetical protein [Bradyrhizobium sp. USDA 4539]
MPFVTPPGSRPVFAEVKSNPPEGATPQATGNQPGTPPSPGAADAVQLILPGNSESETLAATYQTIRDIPGATDEARAAENELTEAVQRRNPANPTTEQQRRFIRALMNYTRVANRIYQASQSPKAPTDPSLRSSLTNLGVGMMRNVFTFTLPVGLSVYAGQLARQSGGDEANVRNMQSGVFAAAIGIISALMEPAGDALRANLKGNVSSILIAGKSAATEGVYKKIVGGLAESTVATAIYASARAGMLAHLAGGGPIADIGKAIGSAMAAALTAGGVMNLTREAALAGGAKATLRANGVSTAEDLPIVPHNRTLKNGIYMRSTDGFTDEGTTSQKIKKYIGSAIGCAVGAAAQFVVELGLGNGLQHFALTSPDSAHPYSTVANSTVANSATLAPDVSTVVGDEVADIFLRFTTFFTVKAAVEALWTTYVTHPDKHANAAGIAESEQAVRNLRASALNGYESLLDQASKELEQGIDTDQAKLKKEAQQSCLILSGTVFGLKENATGKVLEVAELFSAKATKVRNLGDEQLFSRMAVHLERAAKSLHELANSIDSGAPVQPWLKDAQGRLRDVQAILAENTVQPEVQVQPDKVNSAMGEIVPLLVGLREVDRRNNAHSFIHALDDFDRGDGGPDTVLATLNRGGHGAFFASDAVRVIRESGQNEKVIESAAAKLMANLSDKAKSSNLGALTKLNIVLGSLNERLPADRWGENALVGALHEISQTQDNERAVELTRDLRTGLREGRVDAKTLGKVLDQVLDSSVTNLAGPSHAQDPEAAGADMAHRTFTDAQRRQLEKHLGSAFISAVTHETTTSERGLLNVYVQSGQLLATLAADIAAMPKGHQALYREASRLSTSLANPVELNSVKQNDVHFHPTSYSGKVNNLQLLVTYMDANGIDRTNLAGIPSQVRKPTSEQKYYANSQKGIDYRDHDMPLADQLAQIKRKDPPQYEALMRRFDLSITGIDITNGPTVGQELNHRQRMYPGMFKSVGEVTLKKEIVSHKNPHNPHIESKDTQTFLTETFMHGFPLILHCDRGKPGDKQAYEKKLIEALEKSVRDLEKWSPSNDPMVRAGIASADVPRPKAKVIWAHGAGISRFTVASNSHTQRLDSLLNRPSLRDALMIDLSWDFIAHDILRNTYDLFVRKGLPKPITDGIQAMLKTYQAFAVEGSRADKASDLGDENLAAMHRVAAEKIASLHMQTLANFRHLIHTEVEANPVVRGKLDELITAHGNDGNNWLYVLNKHKDRMVFGTDALAVGIKSHGDAAYALNTRMLYPIYDIFSAIARSKNEADQVTPKIARDNYVKFMDDEANGKRRAAWESYLANHDPSSWSTNATPQAFTISEVAEPFLR